LHAQELLPQVGMRDGCFARGQPDAETLRLANPAQSAPNVGNSQHLYDLYQMKTFIVAALASFFVTTQAHAQTSEAGPFATPAGTVQFVRDDRDFVVTLDRQVFDRFDAKALEHFDEPTDTGGKLTRTLVQTEAGPLVYDFRRNPPLVQRSGKRMTIKRVFWQGDDIVMQGSQGWYRMQRGTLTKLQSSTSTYRTN
jgi:hypothetical protein